ncbi:MAG: hypothetical protein BWX87_02754 [Bacteroidetes bacterium ADurb.Bin123]|nr:MAG: hypothetical protein BWX87_02754 [Bacteroidetes bacterium ADurb.Bin123]
MEFFIIQYLNDRLLQNGGSRFQVGFGKSIGFGGRNPPLLLGNDKSVRIHPHHTVRIDPFGLPYQQNRAI